MIRSIVVVLCSFSLVAAQQPPAKPCETERHRQFDFWIGSWDVHDAQGKHVGENEITRP